MLTRVRAIAGPIPVEEPEYAQGLRVAVSAALDYGLAAIESGEEPAPPIPPALLVQARVAARNGVGLDTVLRRYLSGYTLFGDFLVEEARHGGMLGGSELQRLLRAEAVLFDQLLAAISEEHAREQGARRQESAGQRRAERVERLLAGELLDTSDLGYDFEATHIGMVGVGPGAVQPLRHLAAAVDCRLLLVPRPEELVWAWIGARRGLDPAALGRWIDSRWPPGVSLAVGESARGLAGWRLSHEQAKAALPIALRGSGRAIRYADVALLSTIVRDDLLATSLHQIYLVPLQQERDGGATARETLRAYFAAGRNATSAAAALGVSRRTITSRLRAIEELLGRPLNAIPAEVEVALQLDELGRL